MFQKELIVLIGIQARSSSDRLPKKVLMEIEPGVPILDEIIDVCKYAQGFINRKHSYKTICKTCLLIPKEDKELFDKYSSKVEIHKGSLNDVLSRYVDAAKYHHADYIVRITADCVEMQPWVISRAIKSAIRNKADFVSNTIIRTSMEGLDVEVMSKEILEYLHVNSKTPDERENVTLLIKNEKDLGRIVKYFKIVHLLDRTYLGDTKTSVDTLEEFNNAKERRNKLREAKAKADNFGMWEI